MQHEWHKGKPLVVVERRLLWVVLVVPWDVDHGALLHNADLYLEAFVVTWFVQIENTGFLDIYGQAQIVQ